MQMPFVTCAMKAMLDDPDFEHGSLGGNSAGTRLMQPISSIHRWAKTPIDGQVCRRKTPTANAAGGKAAQNPKVTRQGYGHCS